MPAICLNAHHAGEEAIDEKRPRAKGRAQQVQQDADPHYPWGERGFPSEAQRQTGHDADQKRPDESQQRGQNPVEPGGVGVVQHFSPLPQHVRIIAPDDVAAHAERAH